MFKPSAIYLMAAALTALMAGCSTQDETLSIQDAEASNLLMFEGNCNYYTVDKSVQADWQIVDCPAWITPVATEGTAADEIKIYVEELRLSTPQRRGNITVKYANGTTQTMDAQQTSTRAEGKKVIYQRSYATGWSFDVRTYSDSRGIREQVFNLQKIIAKNPSMYDVREAPAEDYDLFYGEDATTLQTDINGKMNIDGKYNSFSGELTGNFGMNTLSDSRRIFSWARQRIARKAVSILETDAYELQEKDWFTQDFAQERLKLIEAQEKGEDLKLMIEQLLGHYGTHVILASVLGGTYDYYYSSVSTKEVDNMDIEGAIKFGFDEKFQISGDAKYKDAFEHLGSEVIEKFYVKGGDAISLARSVQLKVAGDAVKEWKESLTEDKYELIEYRLTPIEAFFPDEVSEAITNYLEDLYYNQMPLTRAEK